MKEEKKKIDRTQEEKAEEELTRAQRKRFNRNLAEKGIVAGGALSGLGAASVLSGRQIDKILKNRKEVWVGNFNPKTLAKGSKIAGGVMLGVGLPVAGVSAYKHYKYKKEDKKNDNKA